LKRFLSISFAILSGLLVIVYGMACLTPYISPARFWPMGFLGLAFPVLLVLLFFTALIWLFIRRKTGLLLLLVIVAGSKHISVLFAWNKTNPFVQQKQQGTVRILSWNVKNFDTHDLARDSTNSLRHKMLNYINAQQADIMCFQDFAEFSNNLLPSNISYLKDSLHYTYHYFADDYKSYPPWGPAYAGIALFSKYPLSHIERVMYPGKRIPESIIVADITIHNQLRRLVVTHLQSMHLKQLKPLDKEPWDDNQDSSIIYSDNRFNKLKFFLPYHAEQSEVVRKVIDESPYPVIFSADMNEVPGSYAYYHIRGNLKDVFLEKGFGLGRTYYAISPTLRIDHLFVSPSINVVQYKKDDIYMSDHYPQVLDVEW